MKPYHDMHDNFLKIGDVVSFSCWGGIQVGKILRFGDESTSHQKYSTAYVASLKGYSFGQWEATCILSKLSDEELMLLMLEDKC